MHFPTWVEEPVTQNEEEKARKRLSYMVRRLALELTEEGSVTALCALCGVERSSVHQSIAQGRFAAATATKIERAIGRDQVRYEDLMNPLGMMAVETS